MAPHLAQGDGVDWQSIPKILEKLKKEGIAAETWQQAAAVREGNPFAQLHSKDNIGFGSGGALLQKLNRDTFKCAFKCPGYRDVGA